MKNKILLGVVLILFVVYLLIGSTNNSTSFFNEENKDIKDYLIGVVACEMPASYELDALKAQVIASRTYAYYKNFKMTNNTDTQCLITIDEMKNKWKDNFDLYYNKIKLAVDSTNNLVMMYDNKIISAYFFSSSNGYTESALNVFKENKNYLTTVQSFEKVDIKTVVFTRENFLKKLGLNLGNIRVGEILRNNSNHIETIVICDKKFTGIEVRKLLGLRSTDFEIIVNDNVEITTYGHGHGVGMSQKGANSLALKGYTYDDILKHYYQNVEIVSIN